MSTEWIDTLFPNINKKSSRIPIQEEVSESARGSSNLKLASKHLALQEYDISKIAEGKKKGVYTKKELEKIAEILGIPTSLKKPELVDEILRKWKQRFPEDFET